MLLRTIKTTEMNKNTGRVATKDEIKKRTILPTAPEFGPTIAKHIKQERTDDATPIQRYCCPESHAIQTNLYKQINQTLATRKHVTSKTHKSRSHLKLSTQRDSNQCEDQDSSKDKRLKRRLSLFDIHLISRGNPTQQVKPTAGLKVIARQIPTAERPSDVY